jgi:hypothetical protein
MTRKNNNTELTDIDVMGLAVLFNQVLEMNNQQGGNK